MGLQSKAIASAQAVGQSAGVKMDVTPFMSRNAVVCILTSSNDRVVKLQETNDDGATWTDVAGVTLSAGTDRFPISSLADEYRIDVSGGAAGTGDCEFEA